MKKYQDLSRKVGKMWSVKKKVVQGWVGALGTIPLRLNNNLRTIEVGIPVEKIQRSQQEFLGRCRRGIEDTENKQRESLSLICS